MGIAREDLGKYVKAKKDRSGEKSYIGKKYTYAKNIHRPKINISKKQHIQAKENMPRRKKNA